MNKWHKKTGYNKYLKCKMVWFYANSGDRTFFFRWIDVIDCIESLDGVIDELYLDLVDRPLTSRDIEKISILFIRYKIDRKQLEAFKTPENSDAFRIYKKKRITRTVNCPIPRVRKQHVCLVYKNPKFYSFLDKEIFFAWFNTNPSAVGIKDKEDALYLYIKSASIPYEDIHDVIVLFQKYKIPNIEQLRVFTASDYPEMFIDSTAPWYKNIFLDKNQSSDL